MMTLRALKELVAEANVENAAPKLGTLLKDGVSIVVKEVINENCEIMVFENGYVYYRVDNHETIFPLHEVGTYTYGSVKKSSVLEGDFFENENWYTRLILEGEDRITSNENRHHRRFCISYSCEEEDWDVLKDHTVDVLERNMLQDLLKEVFEKMDERAARAIVASLEHGLTHEEIGMLIHMNRNAVSKMIKRNLEKVKKNFKIEDGELVLRDQK